MATALPTLAAWRAGTLSWRDRSGRVGIAWGVLFVCGLVQLAAFMTRNGGMVTAGGMAYALLAPAVLVPALLALVGGPPQRWSAALAAVLVLWGVAAMLAIGTGRRITFVYSTPVHFVLLALSIVALGAQGRRAADPLSRDAEPGWVWIGVGHVVYFLTYTIGRALVELVVPQGRAAQLNAHFATLIIYAFAMAAIAWGIWMGRARRPAPPPRGTPLPTAG
ncbi:hypothetical protein [Roseisolibacter sp. H3M3-2]|uniref:hypothetical protein n=1 Tax=Roseisolibacter sp. H3M3-2 TaxID=3031323 RepID=UPI0023D9814F|nr:hypothetical protein [Roseisolibacter sp. H3M3-2]